MHMSNVCVCAHARVCACNTHTHTQIEKFLNKLRKLEWRRVQSPISFSQMRILFCRLYLPKENYIPQHPEEEEKGGSCCFQ